MFPLDHMFSRFVRRGSLRVIDHNDREHLFAGGSGPEVTICITDPSLYRKVFLNPELYVGEAYMDGTLRMESGTIRDFLLLYAQNREHLRGQATQRLVRGLYKKARRWLAHNTLSRARRNVAHHYDLSNDFYRLFLDDDLNYSCGYFTDANESIEAAQQNKLRHIAAKLHLDAGMSVLDIGSGWGSMAMYLAEHFDVDVLGVTLSVEQQALATERARQRGLEQRVRFALEDYREVTQRFDRIVSIGMFEHVGVKSYPAFFARVREMLADDGIMLLHSIGRLAGPGTTVPWLTRYIFPGGYSPAMSETLPVIEAAGLCITDIEVLRYHYAETLLAWDRRFQANRARAAAMFDERFCRMWEFYLIGCEMGFRYGRQMVFQTQLAKSMAAVPMTRDYMFAAENDLRHRDAPENAKVSGGLSGRKQA